VVEFTRSLYRGDAYDFAVELKLPEERSSLTMTTHMAREVAEIPAVARFLTESAPEVPRAAPGDAAAQPGLLATVARGSSDHAATYLKYAASSFWRACRWPRSGRRSRRSTGVRCGWAGRPASAFRNPAKAPTSSR
jgi:hypothetical protein